MTTETLLRIGDVAERVGTTTRTIRYYEEIGLLGAADRPRRGPHRAYTEDDVERLEPILRLQELLGVSLDDLRPLVDARAALRAEFDAATDNHRRREIAREALPLLDRQLEMVRARRDELDALEADLAGRRERALQRLR